MNSKLIPGNVGAAALVLLALGVSVSLAAPPPPPTANLVLRLKADSLGLNEGDSVTAWADSSGNGNNTTQPDGVAVQPTFHSNSFKGMPAVRFDGDDFLRLTRLNLPAGLSYFAVMRTVVNDTDTSYGLNPPQTLIGDNTGFIENGFGVNGTKAQYQYTGPTFNVTSSTTVNDGKPWLIEVTHDDVTGNVALYVQGVANGTGTSTYLPAFYGFNRIGGGVNLSNLGGPSANDFFRGEVAEILVYNTAISAADRLTVETYLIDTYIPEPSSAILLGMAGVALLRRRRARSLSC